MQELIEATDNENRRLTLEHKYISTRGLWRREHDWTSDATNEDGEIGAVRPFPIPNIIIYKIYKKYSRHLSDGLGTWNQPKNGF